MLLSRPCDGSARTGTLPLHTHVPCTPGTAQILGQADLETLQKIIQTPKPSTAAAIHVSC